jgi:putative ABC transport system substrate-binding protein
VGQVTIATVARTGGNRLVGVSTRRLYRSHPQSKGEHPAELPVQQVTKVQLVINLKTAKA